MRMGASMRWVIGTSCAQPLPRERESYIAPLRLLFQAESLRWIRLGYLGADPKNVKTDGAAVCLKGGIL